MEHQANGAEYSTLFNTNHIFNSTILLKKYTFYEEQILKLLQLCNYRFIIFSLNEEDRHCTDAISLLVFKKCIHWKIQTSRPASIGIFFAQLQIFWSTFANGYKQNYCFDISFQKFFSNIILTTDLCILCKMVSQFSVEKFLSHSAEKFRRGTFLCFIKYLVSKNVRDKRGGGYHDFRSNFFCLTVPKISVRESFTIALISGIGKVSMRRGYQDFPSKTFYLTVPKNFVRESFRVSPTSSIQKSSG